MLFSTLIGGSSTVQPTTSGKVTTTARPPKTSTGGSTARPPKTTTGVGGSTAKSTTAHTTTAPNTCYWEVNVTMDDGSENAWTGTYGITYPSELNGFNVYAKTSSNGARSRVFLS